MGRCVHGFLIVSAMLATGCGGGSSSTDVSANPPGPTPESAPAPPAPPPSVPATLRFASGFEPPVAVTPDSRRGNIVQPITGGDVAPFDWQSPLFGEPSGEAIGIQSVVGVSTRFPAATYSRGTTPVVVGRDGRMTHALSLANVLASPNTTVQQIALRRVGMTEEPVFYERYWIKFDVDTLARATQVGARDFYQIFWEVKAEPDYRIRLQLQYSDDQGLYWQAQADNLQTSDPIWSSHLDSVPVTLANVNQAAGWHRIEVWLDRPGGRFRAAVDGVLLADHHGPLMGPSGKPVNVMLTMIVYSGVAPLAAALFDDVEIWDSPPADAWSAPSR